MKWLHTLKLTVHMNWLLTNYFPFGIVDFQQLFFSVRKISPLFLKFIPRVSDQHIIIFHFFFPPKVSNG